MFKLIYHLFFQIPAEGILYFGVTVVPAEECAFITSNLCPACCGELISNNFSLLTKFVVIQLSSKIRPI